MMTAKYSDALRRVAPILAELPQGHRILRTLAHYERMGEGQDGWDTAEAVYWLGNYWHDGQCSPLYRAMCATEFTPSPLASGPTEDSAAQDVFWAIEQHVNPSPDCDDWWSEEGPEGHGPRGHVQGSEQA